MLCDDLVGGDTVGHVLARHGIAIRPGEPEGAAPVSLVGVLVRASLHHGEVRLVACQGSEALGKFVIRSRLIDVGKPCLFGHAEADIEKYAAFGGGGGSCFRSRGKTAKANRFQCGQCDQGSRSTEEVAAFHVELHYFEFSQLSIGQLNITLSILLA